MENKERQKEELSYSRLVCLRFNKWGNLLIGGLSWATTRQVHLHICLLKSKSLYRYFNGVQSHIQYRWSQHHLTLSRLCPWGSFQCGQDKWITHSNNRGGGLEPPIARSTSDHVLSKTSSHSM